MNKFILIDTDVAINILRKKSEFIEKFTLLNRDYTICYSPIVIAEIYSGIFDKEREIVKNLFSFLKCLNIDSEIGILAGEYANRYKKAYNKISLEDYLIASTAKKYNCSLWTNNKRHYPMEDINLI